MILYFIITFLFILSIVLLVMVTKKSKSYGNDMKMLTNQEVEQLPEEEKKKYKKWESLQEWELRLLIPLFLLALIFGLSTVGFMHHLPAERDKILAEKSLIIYKAQNGEYKDNGDMISAIDEFNDDVASKKKALENPWINWFVSRHYKDIDPINYTIDLEGVEYKNNKNTAP